MMSRSRPNALFREGTAGESSQSAPPKVGFEQPCGIEQAGRELPLQSHECHAYCVEFRWYRVIYCALMIFIRAHFYCQEEQ